jgi:hypothetical protein
MKKLLAITAVAAMAAGISIAGAQTTMNKDQAGSPRGKGSGAFCLTGSAGTSNCTFASIAECQKMAKSGQKCTPNQNNATTGAK